MEAAGTALIQGGGHREENEVVLFQQVLQPVGLPSSLPTSQSYADILAGLNTGAAATLSIPMTVAHGVIMLSPSQCWTKHFVSCDGGLPLSLVRAVAIFEGIVWPSCTQERKSLVRRISKTTSRNASYGISTYGAIQADKVIGKTLWLCYVVQSVEYRPNPVAIPPSMKDATAAWNLSFGSRLWHYYSARIRVGGLPSFWNINDSIFDNRATGRVVNTMFFKHYASFVANIFPSHPIAGVTDCIDLHGDGASMHAWMWLIIKNQEWQAQAQYDKSKVQWTETALHLKHSVARALAGDPYDATIGMIVTTRFSSEPPLPIAHWGNAISATSTIEIDSSVALTRGSSIRRIIVTNEGGRSFDVSIPKSLRMIGVEFPTYGDPRTF